MILTPPFSISGEAGKSLDLGAVPFSLIGVGDATLKLRSLDADVLTFSLRDNGSRPAIPDDGQWITLKDSTGQTLFTGIAKRSFSYPAKIYSYEVSNVYKGLMETPLLGDDGRPFLLYIADDLGLRLRDLLIRAANTGLPIQAPDEMPPLYLAPKQAFRAFTYAAALEDCCKWAPDLVTRMDYSTSPPTLRFESRSAAIAHPLSLDADNHKSLSLSLTALPEARALSVSFAYARRNGDFGINVYTQTAGNDAAEANRKISLYLSGVERSDMLVSEALTKASYAANAANLALAALGETITNSLIEDAVWQPTWDAISAGDLHGGITDALAVDPSFEMVVPPGTTTLHNGYYTERGSTVGIGFGGDTYNYSAIAFYVANNALTPQAGWYAINPGVFDAADLALVGASSASLYAVGDMLYEILGPYGPYDNPQYQLFKYTAHRFYFYGNENLGYPVGDNRYFMFYRVKVPVLAINVAPSVVAAAVAARDAGTDSSFLARTEFVEAPPDLAKNYFERQDWTPYKGSVAFAPSVAEIPAPGDFINILGNALPPEWAEMKVPIAETSIDLATRAATCTIGPSPRQDFQSLIDRLRIPQEDNYQAG